jgi:hypothetical protein
MYSEIDIDRIITTIYNCKNMQIYKCKYWRKGRTDIRKNIYIHLYTWIYRAHGDIWTSFVYRRKFVETNTSVNNGRFSSKRLLKLIASLRNWFDIDQLKLILNIYNLSSLSRRLSRRQSYTREAKSLLLTVRCENIPEALYFLIRIVQFI